MTLLQYEGSFLPPGQLPALMTLEPELTSIFWGRLDQLVIGHNVVLDGSTRDAGNTGFTTSLRPGLLLGKISATGKYKQFDPAATDGSQFVAGVLLHSLFMQRGGANQDRFVGYVLFGGNVKVYGLVIASETTAGIVGKDAEFTIRSQMKHSFRFDDDPVGYSISGERTFQVKTADYAVVNADAGSAFITTGAVAPVVFTLPADPVKDMVFWFYNAADQDMTIVAGTPDSLIVFNDLAADSVALSTAGEKIGGSFKVIGTGTAWLVVPYLWDGQTATFVTA